MILLLGGAHSGRHAFCASLPVAPSECTTVTQADAAAFAEEYACLQPQSSADGASVPFFTEREFAPLSAVCARFSTYRVVIATELGLGIIPLDEKERALREANGRLNCALASLADCVVLLVSGIPQVIKGNLEKALSAQPLFLLCFRHGSTNANLERRYAGSGTDSPLCDEGKAQIAAEKMHLASFAERCAPSVAAKLLSPAVVYVSPMRRCLETARLLYPNTDFCIEKDLCEIDFGAFENKTADELLASSVTKDAYQAFVDGGVRFGSANPVRCPPTDASAGESTAQFVVRTKAAFSRCAPAPAADGAAVDEKAAPRVIVVVAHGGTQMALFDSFSAYKGSTVRAPSYYDWQTACAGFRFGAISV